jgi:hypothetical protein
MHELSWYWTFVKLTASGDYTRHKIPQATINLDSFLEEIYDQQLSTDHQRHKIVQTQLIHKLRNSPNFETRFQAEVCLRCYVSNAILQSCQYLLNQFSDSCQIKLNEILVRVLNDVDLTQSLYRSSIQSYQPFVAEILAKPFNPELSRLKTWTRLKIRQHQEIRHLFLEHGILMSSDWAILNQTEQKDLQVLLNCGLLTLQECQENSTLLKYYHQVYRHQWRKNRHKGSCPTPTTKQLEKIAFRFRIKTELNLSVEKILYQLLNLAQKIRTYRIYDQGGVVLEASEDHSETLENIPYCSSDVDELEEQITFVIQCLDQAILETIQARIISLQRHSPDKASKYLIALKLYFCPEPSQSLTMSDIAAQLQLKGQFEVTRLLQIKNFCPHIQNRTVLHLQNYLMKWTEVLSHPERLQQIRAAVHELVERPRKSHPSTQTSLFIQRLNLVTEKLLHEELLDYKTAK